MSDPFQDVHLLVLISVNVAGGLLLRELHLNRLEGYRSKIKLQADSQTRLVYLAEYFIHLFLALIVGECHVDEEKPSVNINDLIRR